MRSITISKDINEPHIRISTEKLDNEKGTVVKTTMLLTHREAELLGQQITQASNPRKGAILCIQHNKEVFSEAKS